MPRSTIGKERGGPVGGVWVSFEGCFKLMVETLNYPIGDGMVGSCVNSSDAKEMCQLFPLVRLKLSASVRCEGGWDAKMRDPA